LSDQIPGAVSVPLMRIVPVIVMSKQAYLGDRDKSWHPHVMFFLPLAEPADWGAGLPGSPILAFKDTSDQLTVYLVPVGRWSDGTPDPNGHAHQD